MDSNQEPQSCKDFALPLSYADGLAEEPRFERGRAFTVSRAKTWRVTNYTIPQQNGVARGIEPRLLPRRDALPTELEATQNVAGNVGFELSRPYQPSRFQDGLSHL